MPKSKDVSPAGAKIFFQIYFMTNSSKNQLLIQTKKSHTTYLHAIVYENYTTLAIGSTNSNLLLAKTVFQMLPNWELAMGPYFVVYPQGNFVNLQMYLPKFL